LQELHGNELCGRVWVSWTFDVAMSNILSFFVHFLWEDLMRLGHLLGFKSLVLKNELPQNMTSWLLILGQGIKR
jgi:hypothetical protein